MATVPSGYIFIDVSANKVYTEGQTMPAVAEGDSLQATGSSAASKPGYTYHVANTAVSMGMTVGSESFKTTAAGWFCAVDAGVTATSVSIPASICGIAVRVLNIYSNNVVTVTIPSSNLQYISGASKTKLKTIAGSFPSSLLGVRFYSCPDLESVPANLNVCTNMTIGRYMFRGCSKLRTVATLPPNITSLEYAFEGCASLTSAPAIPSKVVSAYYAFANCSSLAAAPTNNSRVLTSIYSMFESCTSLTDAGNFYIPSSVTSMASMFAGCTKLAAPPTPVRGTNAQIFSMFEACTLLQTAPDFEGTFATGTALFKNCENLSEAPELPPTVTSWGEAFQNCKALTEIPIIPEGVYSIGHMFAGCIGLGWQAVYLPSSVQYTIGAFEGCVNFTGVVWSDIDPDKVKNIADTFKDTVKPIIVTGAGLVSSLANEGSGNVHAELYARATDTQTARCDFDGTLNDSGDFVKLTVPFTAPVLENSYIYVPKVYIKNAQQQPSKNWKLTVDSEEQIIPDSTDISAERILIGDIIGSGIFETVFPFTDDNVSYKIYIPTSCSDVAKGFDQTGNMIRGVHYWNGLGGSAIFTGSTYIFDALPTGKAFKIGGAIDEASETGFIVGNDGLPLNDQYPSSFNGPVFLKSTVNINGSDGLMRLLVDYLHPVGSYYETSDGEFDPNTVWGGTWVLEDSGQVHVSAGTGYGIGETGGSKTHVHATKNHTLTVNEIPSHTHDITYAQYNRGTGSSTTSALQYTGSTKTTNPTGGGLPHNHGNTEAASNMMPYIVVNRWHRIA